MKPEVRHNSTPNSFPWQVTISTSSRSPGPGDAVEGSYQSGSVIGQLEGEVVDGELRWLGTQPGLEWGGKLQMSKEGRRLSGTYSNTTDIDRTGGF